MAHVVVAFVFMLVGVLALVPSCAVTQKSATVTSISIASCNTWVLVRAQDGRAIQGIVIRNPWVGWQATDSRGYACFWLTEPTAFRIDGDPWFTSEDILLWPDDNAREVRLSRVARAN